MHLDLWNLGEESRIRKPSSEGYRSQRGVIKAIHWQESVNKKIMGFIEEWGACWHSGVCVISPRDLNCL